jgi:hypothetical protein
LKEFNISSEEGSLGAEGTYLSRISLLALLRDFDFLFVFVLV